MKWPDIHWKPPSVSCFRDDAEDPHDFAPGQMHWTPRFQHGSSMMQFVFSDTRISGNLNIAGWKIPMDLIGNTSTQSRSILQPAMLVYWRVQVQFCYSYLVPKKQHFFMDGHGETPIFLWWFGVIQWKQPILKWMFQVLGNFNVDS